MSLPSPYLSVVVPVFNEEDNLTLLLEEIATALAASGWHYEVLVIDDGSKDGSPRQLRRLAAEFEVLRPLLLAENRGQSAALGIGFKAARGQVVVTMDGDLQNDPADIPRVVAGLDEADLVSGVRSNRQDDWRRRLASRIANAVRRTFVRDGVSDVGCSLKAYRAEFLQGIPVFDGMHRFLPALAKANGARIREVDVNHRPRRHGVSKYTIGNRLWGGGIADLFGVRWLQRRWIGGHAAGSDVGVEESS